MQLCDAFDLPVLFLCDTPGFMVGPEAEKTGARPPLQPACSSPAPASTVPFFTVVLRKGYGLGAQAMAGGSFRAPLFTVAWPTGEFGGMGLEGAVQLGYRKRAGGHRGPRTSASARSTQMVAARLRARQGDQQAAYFEVDDVIDPADTRRWIRTLFERRRIGGLGGRGPASAGPNIDAGERRRRRLAMPPVGLGRPRR